MSLATSSRSRKNIAIIGSGISSLGAASLLYPHHNITVYEKNSYIGGHSRTVEITIQDKVISVDTGFIVFNKQNYPLLTRLFNSLGVPYVESDMSFGASIDHGWLEYGSQSLGNVLAQKQNIARPAFWGMVADILKFNKKAIEYIDTEPSFTLGDLLNELGCQSWFRDYYLLAMGGAIWSTPLADMLNFPAQTFVQFFNNHGLLTINQHPQWYTVKGGSAEYVRILSTPFKECIRLNCGAEQVRRINSGVEVIDTQGGHQIYDEVILGCHADQSLSLIKNPTPDEQRILSKFKYQPNRAVLHSDVSFMPKRKKAWASWVYLSETRNVHNSSVSLSYWMNNLQPLETEMPVIVTLNPGHEPDPRLVYNDYMFDHPVFDIAAISHQSEISKIQGQDRLWFCGAYQRYGFHEDGLGSAVQVAQYMGIDPPW